MQKRFKRLHHDHTPSAIRERLKVKSKSLVKDFVYGAIDGTVTTFAIVAGVVGAKLDTTTILILGFANVLADGFSMAASNFMGTRAELEEKEIISKYEENQISTTPEGEREEVRQIYLKKGFRGEVLDSIVEHITNDKKLWLSTMLVEEYGFSESKESPFKAALATFVAFIMFGMIPLIPFMFKMEASFLLASLCTAIAFFSAGALKSKWTMGSPWKSGLETLGIGGFAAALAYYVGKFLGELPS